MLDYLGAPVRVGICASLRPQQLPFGVAPAHTVLAPYVTAVLSSGAVPLMLPCTVSTDGAFLTHSQHLVKILPREVVDKFLPP